MGPAEALSKGAPGGVTAPVLLSLGPGGWPDPVPPPQDPLSILWSHTSMPVLLWLGSHLPAVLLQAVSLLTGAIFYQSPGDTLFRDLFLPFCVFTSILRGCRWITAIFVQRSCFLCLQSLCHKTIMIQNDICIPLGAHGTNRSHSVS